ncbi:tyrosine-type recombinase/integrase [Novosphingobium sp. ERN07]|nr:tyrosine-type recombinase/integrase [Novosphingobium sp. ERN07]
MFWNSRYQRPVVTVSHVWCAIRKEALLTNVRLHDLRHTYASHAALNRESLPMIGKLLGHAKVGSTARYAHLDDAHLLDAAEIVGSAIGEYLNISRFQSGR